LLKTNAFIVIPTEGMVFPALELQTVMSVFRGRYVYALERTAKLDDTGEELNEEAIFKICRKFPRLWRNVESDVNDGFKPLNQDEDLFLSNLKRTNPVEIELIGLAIPIASAVILSGGKLQVGPLKVELPPIGYGIEKLRASLRPTIPRKQEEIGSTRRIGTAQRKGVPKPV
jgi:hypothetical protein